ncbi:MAG: NAD(P)/FAD-dependent oxidoreductase [Chloroflexota bacterium]|nr:NAD(P)/FAD-dependent oxidoreductase [Chloroflexota bacterium]
MRLADDTLRLMGDARKLYGDFDITRTWALTSPPDPTTDTDLETYLRSIGFNADQLYYTRRSWGNAAGDDIARLSAQAAYQDMTDSSAGEGDYRILDGYDRIPHGLAHGLDIRLNQQVESIAWDARGIRVRLTNGAVHDADRVIVTVPLGVLQAGHIRFEPGLPDDKLAAIDRLIMGGAIKMIYRFDEPILGSGIAALYSAVNPPMWWSPTHGHDTDAYAITAFLTGDWAREMRDLGEQSALAHGLRTLAGQLGRAIPTPIATRFIDWSADPFALGGYSTVAVGGRDARSVLAQPIDRRVFFAGEATAPNPWGGTVHGAYASGRRAAAEIISILEPE